MNKRLFRVVLILVIAVILFAGCGSSTPPPAETPPAEDPTQPAEDPTQPAESTTLEGTWRIDQTNTTFIYKVGGVEVDGMSYQSKCPETRVIPGYEDFSETAQRYLQLIKGKYKIFVKYRFNNVPEELHLPPSDFFILEGEAEYSVTGNEITVIPKEIEATLVGTFTINDTALTIIFEKTDDGYYWDEENKKIVYIPEGELPEGLQPCTREYKDETKFTEVPDSEIGELIDIKEYPDLIKLHPHWQISLNNEIPSALKYTLDS